MVMKSKRDKIKIYSKEATYKVGEKIRHEVFNDEGRILKKISCGGNYQKMVVNFEILGKKILIEKKPSRKAKLGNRVAIRFEASLENGEVIDETHRNRPLKLTLGKHKLFPSVEMKIVNMQQGESTTISLSPEEAYGRYNEALVMEVSKKAINDENPKVGDRKIIRRRDGALIDAKVKDIQNNRILLDANHPFAGKTIDYDIELVKILE